MLNLSLPTCVRFSEIRSVSDDDKKGIAQKGDEIFEPLVALMHQNYKIESSEVQKVIKKHFDLLSECHEANKNLYLSYATLYSEFPEFIDYFASYDPKFSGFISEAIRFYANKNL